MFQVSTFKQTRATKGTIQHLEEVYEQILTDPTLDSQIKHLRSLTDPEEKRKFKANHLPAFTPAGVFTQRGAKYLKTHSGLIVYDFDDLTESEIRKWRPTLEALPFVVMSFVSPGGEGLKTLVRVEPTPTDARTHADSWRQGFDHFTQLGIEADQSGKDLPRLCFFSRDPDAYINLAATAFEITPPVKPKPSTKTHKPIDPQTETERIRSALDSIPADDYQTWIDIGMALHHAPEVTTGYELWANWSSKSSKFNPNEDLQRKWSSFASGSGITIATLFQYAKDNGWQDQTRTPPTQKNRPPVDTKAKAVAAAEKKVKSDWQGRKKKSQIKLGIQATPIALELSEAEIDAIIEANTPTLNLTSARSIFDTDFEDLWFAVPNLIPEGLTILAGPPKIGKSFLCMNVALAVAGGGLALGTREIDEPMPVLYCALEDSKRRVQNRLEMLAPEGDIPENLFFLTQGELASVLDTAGIELFDEPVAANGIQLIVIDTWQRVKPTAGKFSKGTLYEDDYELLGQLQAWALRKNIAIMVVHHTNKSVDPDNVYNQISGSTGIQAAVDSMLLLTRRNGEYLLNVTGRDFEEQEWGMSFSDGHWSIEGTADEVLLSNQRRAIMTVLSEAEDTLTPKEITEILNEKIQNVRMTLSRMLKDGSITRTGRGKYRVVDDEPEPIVLPDTHQAITSANNEPPDPDVSDDPEFDKAMIGLTKYFHVREFAEADVHHAFGKLAPALIYELKGLVNEGRKLNNYCVRFENDLFQFYK